MQSTQILQAAHTARPDLIEKVATAVALLGAFDREYEKELVAELKYIADYTSEKVAAADWGKFTMALGGSLAAGLGATMATDLYDAAKRGLTKGRNFKRVMDANPELKQFDNKVLRSSFDTLHRYTPEFTADPILGGALMGAIVASPANAVAIVKDFVGARKNLLEAKHKQYSPSHTGLERFEDRHGDAMKLERLKNQLRHDSTNTSALASEARRHAADLQMERRKMTTQHLKHEGKPFSSAMAAMHPDTDI